MTFSGHSQVIVMPLEDEMRAEMKKLESKIFIIDHELEKLHNKILQLINTRKKKDHDLRVLKANFGEPTEDEKDFQTTLARLLKEKV